MRIELEIRVEYGAIEAFGSLMPRKLDMGETLSDVGLAWIVVDILPDFRSNHLIIISYSNYNDQQIPPISRKI
jgi:hypothetical protein